MAAQQTRARPRVWVSRPLFDDMTDRLREYFDVQAETEDHAWTAAQVGEKLRDMHGAVLGVSDPVDARAIAQAPRLRVLANTAVGYDNLDLAALTAAGIVATNTPDVLNEAVADFAWALLLAAARRVGEGERYLRAGRWQGSSFHLLLGGEVHGRTLGILGMGRIGQAIARRAIGFRMPVIYHNRSRLEATVERECNARYASRDELLRNADYLVLVLPLTPANRHAIGTAELALMKPTATLVNIARGGIVDDAALAAALSEGRLAAAGLDVFENEPALYARLPTLDNVVLTPHIASASLDTRRAMAGVAVDNLIAALGFGAHAGRPPNVLNPEALQTSA
ncbi:2-hydroxyacid dehydrogenase [Rudaea sp.]|jgi:gluconate 2-dehydrogenase|uniref:2-hydroxyacid dehydrogenase n=1 Tax=Rudaea sp. TaxID=2136325 RepID=UPI0039C90922